MAEDNRAKTNASQAQKNPASVTVTAQSVASSVSESVNAGPIRAKIGADLGRMIMIRQLRDKEGLSRRNAAKLLDELERQKPSIWTDAMTQAGIEVETDPTAAGQSTGKIGDGHILNWLLDPANQAKIQQFTEWVMTFVKLLLPLFGG